MLVCGSIAMARLGFDDAKQSVDVEERRLRSGSRFVSTGSCIYHYLIHFACEYVLRTVFYTVCEHFLAIELGLHASEVGRW